MSNAGIHLDDNLLAHMALHHLPSDHHTTRQVIIATAESSNTALTVNSVLSQINELIRDGEMNKSSATALNVRSKTYQQGQPTWERCLNGTHNPKTAHSAENCWQVHPEKNPRPPNCHHSANNAVISGQALCATALNGNKYGKPILDTGTTQSMFRDHKHFSNYAPTTTSIEVANDDTIAGHGLGYVQASHHGSPLTFCNSIHIPGLKKDLISMVELAKKGCSIEFKDNGKFEVVQDSDVVLSGNLVEGLMELDIELGQISTSAPHAMTAKADGSLLHS